MRPEADKPKRPIVGFLVDQHEVRADVAVAEVAPGAAQRVVVVAEIERNVVGERIHDDREPFIEVAPVCSRA